MDIDSIGESEWISLLDGNRAIQFEFLALQLFLASLRGRRKAEGLPIADCIRELRNFYSKFSRFPLAEKDFSKIARRDSSFAVHLLDPEETARRILAGQTLILAGEEALLSKMPSGNWIGGTTPYFLTEDGGRLCRDKILVTELPCQFLATTRVYSPAELPEVYQQAQPRHVSFLILPAGSRAHVEFGLSAPQYAGFALHPLVGWVAGVELSKVGSIAPKVFCGGPLPFDNAGAVLQITLPSEYLAQINIINLFQPGQGDAICFPTNGFSARTAVVNGQECNFAEYLHQVQADTRLPLVANCCGAMVNVCFKSVDLENGVVRFYAPVVAGREYKLAAPVTDYVSEVEKRLETLAPRNVLFSCNCIQNYLYSGIESRRVGCFVGPVTFGEIGYQLLNRTLVYLEIIKNQSQAEPDLNATAFQLSAAHEELQVSEHRFRVLAEGLPIGVFMTDPHGHNLYENAFCRRLSNEGCKQHSGDDWLRNVHSKDLPGVVSAIEDAQRNGHDLDIEFRFLNPNGTFRWVRSRTSFVRSEKDEIMGRLGVMEDITERKQAELELERVYRELMQASREAGIAEVTTGVLHNVKNIVNSINVSAGVIVGQVQGSKCASLSKVTELLRRHEGNLASFLTEHPKGKLLPGYLEKLNETIIAERSAILEELRHFQKSVEHLKEVVMMQQTYAKFAGAAQTVKPVDLMEDALRLNSAALARHGVQVSREYDVKVGEITVEKHKALQILVNFIRNAKEACEGSNQPDKRLILRVTNGDGGVYLAVIDNGAGIAREHMRRLFQRGFTTKESGHGFGLHSGALAAKDMGAKIHAHSDGPNTGATFTLVLPLAPPAQKRVSSLGRHSSPVRPS